jgi:transcriptional regulator with XRE-family HTH domain
MSTKASKKSSTMSFLDSLAREPLALGSLIQTIREIDAYTQAELARRLGISKSHLCDIEKRRKAVSPERASKFAVDLGYSEEQFVRLALQQMVETAGLRFDVRLSSRSTSRRSRGAG